MTIPRVLEIRAIRVDAIEKKCVKKPEMPWVVDIKEMNALQPGKKCSPLASKMSANFHPQALDSGIPC